MEQPSKSYKLPLLQPPHILPIYLLDKSGIKQWFSFFTDQNFIGVINNDCFVSNWPLNFYSFFWKNSSFQNNLIPTCILYFLFNIWNDFSLWVTMRCLHVHWNTFFFCSPKQILVFSSSFSCIYNLPNKVFIIASHTSDTDRCNVTCHCTYHCPPSCDIPAVVTSIFPRSSTTYGHASVWPHF